MKTSCTCISIKPCTVPALSNLQAPEKYPGKTTGDCKSRSTKFLVILFTLFSLFSSAANYYIAPTGSDAATGDITHPFATLNKAWTVVAAGDFIYMRGGTYSFPSQQILSGKSGTSANPIKVWAYTGEVPILFFSPTNKGVTLSGNYINFKNIQIDGLTTVSGWTNMGGGVY